MPSTTRSAVETERRDLTALDTFTVDPETARDFDDAVSASADGDGIRLWIHIADVAAHVRPGTALDEEAERRANSVYVPGTVEPMLPLVLSSRRLQPLAGRRPARGHGRDRWSGPTGAPRAASFYRSRIRSDLRLDYDELDEIFAGRASPPEAIAEPLRLARRAAAALRDARRRLGARDLHRPSPSSSSTPTATWSGRSRSSRPRRTG